MIAVTCTDRAYVFWGDFLRQKLYVVIASHYIPGRLKHRSPHSRATTTSGVTGWFLRPSSFDASRETSASFDTMAPS